MGDSDDTLLSSPSGRNQSNPPGLYYLSMQQARVVALIPSQHILANNELPILSFHSTILAELLINRSMTQECGTKGLNIYIGFD